MMMTMMVIRREKEEECEWKSRKGDYGLGLAGYFVFGLVVFEV